MKTKRLIFAICTIGITLHSFAIDTKVDQAPPHVIPASTFFDSHSAGKWTLENASTYKEVPCYDWDGSAHLCGKIHNYSSQSGITTFNVRAKDCVTGKEQITVVNIQPDGSFHEDVKVNHPQYVYLTGIIRREVFLIPGDTIEIATTTKTNRSPSTKSAAYFGFRGEKDRDITAVNVLTDTLISHYNLKNLFLRHYIPESEATEEAVIRENEVLCDMLNSTISDLPHFLGNLPISDFAKDILAAKAISTILEVAESNEMEYRFKHQVGLTMTDSVETPVLDKPYHEIDIAAIIGPRKQHNKLIYDNPIMMCVNRMLPNRWEYGCLFDAAQSAASGGINPPLVANYDLKGKSSHELLCEIISNNLTKAGIGDCFAFQLSCVKNLIENLNTHSSLNRETLNRKSEYVSNLMCHVTYPTLAKMLQKAYTNYVEAIVMSESPSEKQSNYTMLDASADADVFEELIKPYKGDLLYLDFWGMYCGPCRAGMIRQKPIIESLADSPFKALYISEDIGGIKEAERWMADENIKGEHIFVSTDNWNRLSALFNFAGIPFGVLVGKNGEILETNFHLEHEEATVNKYLNSAANNN